MDPISATPTPAPRARRWPRVAAWLAVSVLTLVNVGSCLAILSRGARKSSAEANAIGRLRTLDTAQAIFRERGDAARGYAATLGDLGREGLIDARLAGGTTQAYLFRLEAASATTWSATAAPASPGVTGDRAFFVDETGIVRFQWLDRPRATASDPPLEGAR